MPDKRSSRLAADALTLWRIFAAGLVWIGLTTELSFGAKTALAAFLTGAFSDFWDGRFARQAGGCTSYGRVLDPLADKALTLAAFAGLAVRGIVGWWLFWLVAARDLIVTAVRFRRPPERSGARDSGKWKTVFQMLYLTAALALPASGRQPADIPGAEPALAWGSAVIAALTLWSGIRFLFVKASAA